MAEALVPPRPRMEEAGVPPRTSTQWRGRGGGGRGPALNEDCGGRGPAADKNTVAEGVVPLQSRMRMVEALVPLCVQERRGAAVGDEGKGRLS